MDLKIRYHLYFFVTRQTKDHLRAIAFKYLVDRCSLQYGMTLAPVQAFIDFGTAIHMAVENGGQHHKYEGADFI